MLDDGPVENDEAVLALLAPTVAFVAGRGWLRQLRHVLRKGARSREYDAPRALCAPPHASIVERLRPRRPASGTRQEFHDRCILAAFFLVSVSFAPQVASSYKLLDVGLASSLSWAARAVAVTFGALGCAPLDLRRLRLSDVLLVSGLLIAILQFVMAPSISPMEEALFLNGPAAAPFFILLPLARRHVPYARIWRLLATSVVLQLMLGIALFFVGSPEGSHIDDKNDGIVGTMGVANMFAMLCLLVAVRYAYFEDRRAFFVGFGVLGVVLSGSLAAAGCLCLIALIGFAVDRRSRASTAKVVLLAAFGCALYFIPFLLFGLNPPASIEHVMFKVDSLWRLAIGAGSEDISYSVTLRRQVWTDVINGVTRDMNVALFGGLGGYRYFPADSQVVTYVGSFGLPVALMIFAPMLGCVRDLFRMRGRRFVFATLALVLSLFLLSNRMYDYFTGAALAALVISEIRARSQGALER